VRHRAAVEREFLDFKPFRDRYLAAMAQRARTGRLSRGDRPRLEQLVALLAGYVRILRELAEYSTRPSPRNSHRWLGCGTDWSTTTRTSRPNGCTRCWLGDFDRFAEQVLGYADRS